MAEGDGARRGAARGGFPPVSVLADLARWGLYVRARGLMDPRDPRRFVLARRLARGSVLRRGPARALLSDELQRSGLDVSVDACWRAQARVVIDELALGRHDASTLPHFLRFEGLEHLDAALAQGRGVVWVYPHAGPVMLMLAGLVQRGHAYTQYAARGLAPPDVAAAHPELLGHNRLRQAVQAARESDEDRTGATFLDLSTPTRALHRALARNGIVGIAFDGRIGNKWVPMPFLGRTALLNPGCVRLAAQTGALLVPAFCAVAEDDGPSTCHVGAPVDPADPQALARVVGHAEGWIRRAPAGYGPWLLHARVRNAIDDHPMFTDHAPDDRWRMWVERAKERG